MYFGSLLIFSWILLHGALASAAECSFQVREFSNLRKYVECQSKPTLQACELAYTYPYKTNPEDPAGKLEFVSARQPLSYHVTPDEARFALESLKDNPVFIKKIAQSLALTNAYLRENKNLVPPEIADRILKWDIDTSNVASVPLFAIGSTELWEQVPKYQRILYEQRARDFIQKNLELIRSFQNPTNPSALMHPALAQVVASGHWGHFLGVAGAAAVRSVLPGLLRDAGIELGKKRFENSFTRLARFGKYLPKIFARTISVPVGLALSTVTTDATACQGAADPYTSADPERNCKTELKFTPNVLRLLAGRYDDLKDALQIPQVCSFYNQLYDKHLTRPVISDVHCSLFKSPTTHPAITVDLDLGEQTQRVRFTYGKTARPGGALPLLRADISRRDKRYYSGSRRRLNFNPVSGELARDSIHYLEELVPLKLIYNDVVSCCVYPDQADRSACIKGITGNKVQKPGPDSHRIFEEPSAAVR